MSSLYRRETQKRIFELRNSVHECSMKVCNSKTNIIAFRLRERLKLFELIRCLTNEEFQL